MNARAYETFVRPLLFSLDPETAHRLTIELLRAASHFDFALHWLRFFQSPSKPKTLFGLNFPNPIGLAAGLDKNGVALPAWAALTADNLSRFEPPLGVEAYRGDKAWLEALD